MKIENLKSGAILEFDDATDYLTYLLAKCDTGMLANLINIAAAARKNTGSPTDDIILTAIPLDGQMVQLV